MYFAHLFVTLQAKMKKTIDFMEKKPYLMPAMAAIELQHGGQLMDIGSRNGYAAGGSGYGDGGMGGRSGYDDGGDGYSSGVGGRSGYGMGSWDDSSISGRSGYGNGGTGFD